MEAALTDLPRQLRARRFARECEQLRPLGVAFVLRRFGNSLDHADAEDAVSEVVIRLHLQAQAGHPPDNLRAVFFTAARNAAIDLLRSRSARPTVALELVAEAAAAQPTPPERAESSEDIVRLREAMGRMQPNYREAILLRFGLGLTVPEIAARLEISLPAAKKIVLRATKRVRERLESIEAAEFCPQMRELARRSVFDRESAGLAEESESAVLRAHFEHCGSCRSFLTALHDNLHELGSTALLGAFAAEHAGALQQLGAMLGQIPRALQHGTARLRLSAYKASGALQPDGAASAGALAGTGQKIAAICTAGAATTATCLATGILGPGIGVVSTPTPPSHHHAPPALTRTVASHSNAPPAAPTPAPTAPQPQAHASGAASAKTAHRATRSQAESSKASAAAQAEAEFGFEAEATSPAASSAEAATATASAAPAAPAPPSSSPTSSSGAEGAGTEHFGFGG